MACRNVPGMFLAIVKDDKVVLSEGYGFKNVDTNEAFTSQTPMSIQSTSKFMFTILVARMLTKYPKYTFDTTVKELLGDHLELSDKIAEEMLTIRDCVSMAHGLRFPTTTLIENWYATTKYDRIRNTKHYPVVDELRRGFHYSSDGFLFLDKAFEILENKTIEQILRDELFEPLGMVHSNTIGEARDDESYATGYQPGPNGTLLKTTRNFISRSGSNVGGFGLASTADDLAKYLRFVLREGKLEDGTQHVNPDLIKEVLSPQIFYPLPYNGVADGYSLRPDFPTTSQTLSYGMASWHRYYRGFQLVQHTGSHGGCDTLMTYVPDLKIGIYTGLNGPYTDVSWVAETVIQEYILDVLLELPNYLNDTTACTFPAPWGEPVGLPSYQAIPEDVAPALPLDKYTGVFGKEGFGCVSMTLNRTEDDVEVLQFAIGWGRMFAYPKEGRAHQFWLKGVDDMFHYWYIGGYSAAFIESDGLITEMIVSGSTLKRMPDDNKQLCSFYLTGLNSTENEK
ncbi:unnamed protein product [Owenia fusiformis]|uniref:Uncharacterized protein n=1 Tax=Owenia fusiformis TaxID=6347 RepID=A0A8J1TET3_OWEFU|nr:unnamed protein product [Owenia fusiformis]